MISWIKGEIIQKSNDAIFVQSQNIGYEIKLSKETIPSYTKGQQVELFIFPILKNEGFEFYGFSCLTERQLFKLLLTVSGMGAKSAQKIISHYDYKTVIIAIKNNETELFEKISGIGKKTSIKIAIDLEKKNRYNRTRLCN